MNDARSHDSHARGEALGASGVHEKCDASERSSSPLDVGPDAEVADLVDVFIVTYNRSAHLDRTLEQFFSVANPFSRCRVTVLNNASTDDTVEIVQRRMPAHRNLRLISHTLNVGASPNYLRAVELSERPYTWILGDDDLFDFEDAGDVLEALREMRFDLVSLGAPGQNVWERGTSTTTQALVRHGGRYFFVFTFITGVIFRTALFDASCVYEGYKNSLNLYPHFPFLARCLEQDCSVYISASPIVIRDAAADAHNMPFLSWLVGWTTSFASSVKPPWRSRVVFETLGETWPDYAEEVVMAVVEFKATYACAPWRQLGGILFSGWPLTPLWMPAVLIAALPSSVHRLLARYAYRRRLAKATDRFRL